MPLGQMSMDGAGKHGTHLQLSQRVVWHGQFDSARYSQHMSDDEPQSRPLSGSIEPSVPHAETAHNAATARTSEVGMVLLPATDNSPVADSKVIRSATGMRCPSDIDRAPSTQRDELANLGVS